MQIKDVLNKQNDVLHLNQRQLSFIVASLLLIFFFIFILGYYCGKKTGMPSAINQESSNPIETSGFSTLQIKQEENNLFAKNDTQENLAINNDSKIEKKNQDSSGAEFIQANGTKYYGQLAGFGSLKFAKKCEENLKSYGYAVKTVEKTGRTNKGESRIWYQVVTELQNDRENLLKEIQEIKKIANIKKDVPIVAIKEEPKKEIKGARPTENERHTV